MSINFACPRCKHSLKVPDPLAGKKAKCPHCSSTVGVPAVGVPAGPARASRPAAPATAAAPKHNPKVEFAGLARQITSPSGGGKPYKRDRGNPVMKLMFLTLGIFLLGGGTYATVRFKLLDKLGLKGAPSTEVADASGDTKTKEGPAATAKSTQPGTTAPAVKENLPPLVESHFFPDGTVAIASFNFEALTNSKAYGKLKDELAKNDMSPEKLFDAQAKPYVGLQFTAIGRVQAALVTPDERIVVVRPRNPLTTDEVKLSRGGDYKEAKIGRFTIYETTTDAFCLAEEQLLVLGPPALLRKVLERNKLPELKPELEAAYRLMNPAKTAGLAMLPQASDQFKTVLPGAVPKEVETVSAVVVQVDLAQGLDASVTLQCKDAEAAAAAKKATETALAMAKTTLEQLQKDTEVEKLMMLAKKGEEIVGMVKVAAEGAGLAISLTLNEEMVTQLIGLLPGK
jgi:hypothetical protein